MDDYFKKIDLYNKAESRDIKLVSPYTGNAFNH